MELVYFSREYIYIVMVVFVYRGIIKLPHYVSLLSATYFGEINHINFAVETTSQ